MLDKVKNSPQSIRKRKLNKICNTYFPQYGYLHQILDHNIAQEDDGVEDPFFYKYNNLSLSDSEAFFNTEINDRRGRSMFQKVRKKKGAKIKTNWKTIIKYLSPPHKTHKIFQQNTIIYF